MKHLGDITKISGYDTPIVDCIIGGSPCQDLSVAGKREGLSGERSGLFMEQMRIIKEMRKHDRELRGADESIRYSCRPRWAIWENVPGATSSTGGEDFRCVLEEMARVVEEGVAIPRPPKGKWADSGIIIGGGRNNPYSIAWRITNAATWGVPQRRRRISLVADFNGYDAPGILFPETEYKREPERVSSYSPFGSLGGEPRSEVPTVGESGTGDFEPGGEEGQDPSANVEESLGADDIPYTMQDREGCRGGGKGALIQENKSATLSTDNRQYLFQPTGYPEVSDGVVGTLPANYSAFPAARNGAELTMVYRGGEK